MTVAGDVPLAGKNTPERIEAQEKQRQAVELRKGGASYNQIAKALGYANAGGAHKAVAKAIKRAIQEPAEELLALQKERLNHMMLALWPMVQQGDNNAINTGLRVMERLDRLGGLDNPQTLINMTVNNTQHTDAVLVIEGDKTDYINAMRRMVGVRGDGTNKEITGAVVYPQGYPQPGDDDTVEQEVYAYEEHRPYQAPDNASPALRAKIRELTTPREDVVEDVVVVEEDDSGLLSYPPDRSQNGHKNGSGNGKVYKFGMDPRGGGNTE